MSDLIVQRPGWLFVLPWSLQATGGVNQVVKNLIRCFRDGNQFAPHILVTTELLGSDYAAGSPVTGQFCLDLWTPIDDRHLLRSLVSYVYRFPSRYFTLRQILNRNDIKMINPHFPGLNSLVFVALKAFGHFRGQIVLSFHGSDVTSLMGSSALEKLLWKHLLRHVDYITVVSNNLGAELLALEPKIADKITTIYNGVDLEVFAHETVPEKSNPAETMTIISVAAFRELKGHDLLVKAFALAAKKIPNIRLALVGSQGPALKQIRHLIDLLHLNDRITVELDVPPTRIPSLLAEAQLFVLASRREGFPLVLVEAAAAKVPIVCTRAGGMPELITDRVTGRVVDIDDSGALSEAIIDLLADPISAQRLAANCFEHVKNNLTWRQTYHNYLGLSDEIQTPQSQT